MAKRYPTVTTEGMVPSQPGCLVSVSSCNGVSTLNVSRDYKLPNKWGGIGRFHKLDCDGMQFPSSEAAFAFAEWRGYIRRYYTSPDLRARRLRRAYLEQFPDPTDPEYYAEKK